MKKHTDNITWFCVGQTIGGKCIVYKFCRSPSLSMQFHWGTGMTRKKMCYSLNVLYLVSNILLTWFKPSMIILEHQFMYYKFISPFHILFTLYFSINLLLLMINIDRFHFLTIKRLNSTPFFTQGSRAFWNLEFRSRFSVLKMFWNSVFLLIFPGIFICALEIL